MRRVPFNKLILRIVFAVIALVSLQPYCFSQFVEGDTAGFWSVTYNDWPPLIGSPQRKVNATCKKAGAHCYVFVEEPGGSNSVTIH